jgi:hypothetical protein
VLRVAGFLLGWSLSEQVSLAGSLSPFMGVSVSIKAEIYEQMNNYRLSKTFLQHWINQLQNLPGIVMKSEIKF